MLTANDIIVLIFEAIDEFNAEQDESKRLKKSPATAIFGRGTVLDSLDVVNLIVTIEGKLADGHEIFLTLANEKAMSRKVSPFRTVESLAAYIEELLQEGSDE